MSDEEAEDAWRVYYVGHRCGVFGETVALAEAKYLASEGRPVLTPNGKRRTGLPGGTPHEAVTEIAVYAKGGEIFGGALLCARSGRQAVELVTRDPGRLYRLGERSLALRSILDAVGLDPTPPLGFTELDATVRRLSDDPQGFSKLAEDDRDAEWIEVMPRAAVLARWGVKGDRLAARL